MGLLLRPPGKEIVVTFWSGILVNIWAVTLVGTALQAQSATVTHQPSPGRAGASPVAMVGRGGPGLGGTNSHANVATTTVDLDPTIALLQTEVLAISQKVQLDRVTNVAAEAETPPRTHRDVQPASKGATKYERTRFVATR